MISQSKAGSPGRPDERPVSIVSGGLDTPVPQAPSGLPNDATWTRLWTTGRAWLSNDAHYDLMAILCESMEDRAALRRAMRRSRKIVAGSAGQERVHPALKEIDAMDVKIARMLETCGFTPQKQKQIIAPKRGRLDAIRARHSPDGSV